MKKVPMTRVVLDEFSDLALLTDEDKEILRTRALGWSGVKQCREFCISQSTLTRRIEEMRIKYEYLSQRGYLPPNVKI